MGANGNGFRPHQISHVVKLCRKLMREGKTLTQASEIVAPLYDRQPSTVRTLIRRLTPTKDLAHEYMEANALTLAMRVVKHANVSEAIDVLSRPSMGVISPKQLQQDSGAQQGFFLSVEAGSCGAVKVGVAMTSGQAPAPALPEVVETEVIEESVKDLLDIPVKKPKTRREFFGGGRARAAAADARQRLLGGRHGTSSSKQDSDDSHILLGTEAEESWRGGE